MSYKQILTTVRELKQQSIDALHKRVTLLNQVFADPDFRADLGGVDDIKLAEVLDKYLDDTPFFFLEARWLLVQKPDVADWRNKSPRALYDELKSMVVERDNETADESTRTRWSVTKHQWDEKCRECDDLKAKVRQLTAENERLASEVANMKKPRSSSGSVTAKRREPLAVG